MEKYLPEKWRGDTHTLGFVLWVGLYGYPDMYHHDTYGEHVCEWNTIL